jgi:hypothetical protein
MIEWLVWIAAVIFVAGVAHMLGFGAWFDTKALPWLARLFR